MFGPLVSLLTATVVQSFATIKLGPIVAEARGAIGGTVFARGAFGAYAKQRVAPTNPNTPKQAAARALMTVVVNEWMTVLTVAQRDVWNAAVQSFTVPNRIGDAIHLTGLQWFTRCNSLLDLTGQSFVTVPPVVPIIPAPTFTLVHLAATGIQISSLGKWDETEVDRVLLQHSANLSQTKNFWKGPFIVLGSITAAGLAAVPYTILPSASLAVTSRVFFSFRSVNADGSNSFPVIYSQDVGDPV